jgi:hypothetical protein
MSLPDLEPAFPLPAPGDMVQVLVSRGSKTAPGLVAGPAPDWCMVVRVATGPHDLFPVTVLLPSGRLGSYQQGEILGWRQAAPPVRWVTRLLARRVR